MVVDCDAPQRSDLGTISIIREVRNQTIVADLPTIGIEFKVAQAGHESLGGNHFVLQFKSLPEQRSGTVFPAGFFALPRSADPLRAPIPGLEQPHAPTSGLAPFGDVSLPIGHLYPPIIGFSRLQCGAGIAHQIGSVRFHDTGIPDEIRLAAQCLLGGRHLDPVSLLNEPLQVRRSGSIDPGQPRGKHIDRHRSRHVFAGQGSRIQRAFRAASNCQQHRESDVKSFGDFEHNLSIWVHSKFRPNQWFQPIEIII